MAAAPATVWPVPQPRSNKATDPEAPDPASVSDEALVRAARDGDTDAFERLIARHYSFCLAKAYAILRNRGDAEDEVQDAWTEAWKHLWQYQGEGTFGAWLGRIVSNQCLMRIRQRKGAKLISIDEVFETEGSFRLEVIDQRALPEDELGDVQVSSVLMKEIRRVPPLLRNALVMRDVEQLAMRDVAEQLGITIPALKSRLMRARMELKRRLAKHHGVRGQVTLFPTPLRKRAAFVRAS
jgi:RNA polymerase sigma-70 factor (ECF subfamily)